MEKGQEPRGYAVDGCIIIKDGQGLTQGPQNVQTSPPTGVNGVLFK